MKIYNVKWPGYLNILTCSLFEDIFSYKTNDFLLFIFRVFFESIFLYLERDNEWTRMWNRRKNEQIGVRAEKRFCVRRLESDRSIIPVFRSYYVDLKDPHYYNLFPKGTSFKKPTSLSYDDFDDQSQ